MYRHRMLSRLMILPVLLGMLLVGCGPSASPVPPPATVIGPQPAEPTAKLPSNPVAAATATVAAPQVAAPGQATPYLPPMPPGFKEGQAAQEPAVIYPAAAADGAGVALAILHTNDTQGEIDPCG